MAQTYFHHVLAIVGFSVGTYLGGFFGSLSHLALVTEASTFFVNFRALLSMCGFGDTELYVYNGIAMTVVFFVVRIVYYSWVIFVKFRHGGAFSDEMWRKLANENPAKVPVLKVSLVLYVVLWALQCFWFYKIFKGLMKHFLKAKARKEAIAYNELLSNPYNHEKMKVT